MLTQTIASEVKKDQTQVYLIPLGGLQNRHHVIDEFLSMGRGPQNAIVLDDPFVSQRHFRIEKRTKGYVLKDLGSRNGTFVNGVRIHEALLQNNDQILVGESQFLFSYFIQNSDQLKSKNHKWNEQLKKVPAFAGTNHTVLIIGPSGSGKEILAGWIHDNSPRRKAPFITINCSALSESLIESELFGHVKGSFTGATCDRQGAFAAAKGGTLFLDEIGDLSPNLQPKLLRALENQEIRPVGSDKNVKTNVRIVAATHKNLVRQIQQGQFREDLFHRLNICRLSPPSLIERMEDFEDILYSIAKKVKVSFSFGAVEKLKDHDWNGNIRELKNTILRASAYYPGQRIGEQELPSIIDTPEGAESFCMHSGFNKNSNLFLVTKEKLLKHLKFQKALFTIKFETTKLILKFIKKEAGFNLAGLNDLY